MLQPIDIPNHQWKSIKVTTPVAEYLFAMKCMAMRADEEASDRGDIRVLLGQLDIHSAEEALNLVEGFYPSNLIPAKTQFGIQEVVEGWLAETHTPGSRAGRGRTP